MEEIRVKRADMIPERENAPRAVRKLPENSVASIAVINSRETLAGNVVLTSDSC